MGPAYSLNNETDIMLEIFHYGPVQGMQVSSDRVSCIVTQTFLSRSNDVGVPGLFRLSQRDLSSLVLWK